MGWFGNKKFARSARRKARAAGRDPQAEKIRQRRYYRQLSRSAKWLNDFGVVKSASKHNWHRKHERKLYDRHKMV